VCRRELVQIRLSKPPEGLTVSSLPTPATHRYTRAYVKNRGAIADSPKRYLRTQKLFANTLHAHFVRQGCGVELDSVCSLLFLCDILAVVANRIADFLVGEILGFRNVRAGRNYQHDYNCDTCQKQACLKLVHILYSLAVEKKTLPCAFIILYFHVIVKLFC
jgi:hypothetical protein